MVSTAENPESKRYAFEEGRRAIQKHYERIGLKDAYVEETAYPGTYRTRYKYADKPKGSIIIDEITKKELLGKTLQSIKENDYPDYEVIIVDCTEKKEIEEFVEKYQDKRIRVKRGEKIWTASKRKNEGAGCAKGEYLIFLAGNAEFADKEGISELVSMAMRGDVGVVVAVVPAVFVAHVPGRHVWIVLVVFGKVAAQAQRVVLEHRACGLPRLA